MFYEEKLFKCIQNNVARILNSRSINYFIQEDIFLAYCTHFDNKMCEQLEEIGINNCRVLPYNEKEIKVMFTMRDIKSIEKFMLKTGFVEIEHYDYENLSFIKNDGSITLSLFWFKRKYSFRYGDNFRDASNINCCEVDLPPFLEELPYKEAIKNIIIKELRE